MPRAASAWTVRPFHVEGESWHGPAEIDDGFVEFAGERATSYDWSVAPELPYDLAAIRHEVDILGFVKRWGFLRSWDNDEHYIPTVEEFMDHSLAMNLTLYLYGLVSGASSESSNRGVFEYWAGVYTGAIDEDLQSWLWNPARRAQIAEQVDQLARTADLETMAFDIRDELEEDVQEMLTDVEVSIHSLNWMEWPNNDPPPGNFLLTAFPKDLLGRAYLEVALEMTAGTKVAACPDDGRMFAVRDPRQIYCSSQCAGRARYRRFSERRKQRHPK